MPKRKKQPEPSPRRTAPPWLVAAVVAAVLLGVGLYGVRAGWFESDEEELAGPNFPARTGGDAPRHPIVNRDEALARASWGAPEGAPVLDVASSGGPSVAALATRDGRAEATIRVPRKRADGSSYSGYSLEVWSGERRLWGGQVFSAEARDAETIAVSFNSELLRSVGAADAPLTVVVSGNAPPGRGDQLGRLQLTVPPTP